MKVHTITIDWHCTAATGTVNTGHACGTSVRKREKKEKEREGVKKGEKERRREKERWLESGF